MSRRSRFVWKALLALFATCALACMVAWGVLLTRVCSNPRTPDPATGRVVPYSCHGMTVYMSHLEEVLRDWLIPAEVLFIFLSAGVGVMVFLGAVKMRMTVQVHREDSPER